MPSRTVCHFRDITASSTDYSVNFNLGFIPTQVTIHRWAASSQKDVDFHGCLTCRDIEGFFVPMGASDGVGTNFSSGSVNITLPIANWNGQPRFFVSESGAGEPLPLQGARYWVVMTFSRP